MGTLNRAVAIGLLAAASLGIGAAAVENRPMLPAPEQSVSTETKRRNGVKDRNSQPWTYRRCMRNAAPARVRNETARRKAARRAKLRNRRAA